MQPTPAPVHESQQEHLAGTAQKAVDGLARGQIFMLVALVFKTTQVRGHYDVVSLVVSFVAEPSISPWRKEGNVVLRLPTDGKPILSLCLSRKEDLLASGDQDGRIKLWDVASGAALGETQAHSDVLSSLAMSFDGSKLVSGSADGLVKVWRVPTLEQTSVTMRAHTMWVRCVVLVQRDEYVLSGSEDGTIILSSLAGGDVVKVFKGHQPGAWDLDSGIPLGAVYALAVAPDGTSFCTGGAFDKMIHMLHLDKDKSIMALRGHTMAVTTLRFSPDSRLLLSGSLDRSVKLWSLSSGELLKSFEGHTSSVWSVCFLGSNLFASGAADKTWRMWNQDDESVIFYHNSSWCCLGFAKKTSIMFTGDGRGELCEWGIDT